MQKLVTIILIAATRNVQYLVTYLVDKTTDIHRAWAKVFGKCTIMLHHNIFNPPFQKNSNYNMHYRDIYL